MPGRALRLVAKAFVSTAPRTVYNFTVGQDHTYFVVAGGHAVWVHNGVCSEGGTYGFRDLKTGKLYIGSTNDFYRRIGEHIRERRVASYDDVEYRPLDGDRAARRQAEQKWMDDYDPRELSNQRRAVAK